MGGPGGDGVPPGAAGCAANDLRSISAVLVNTVAECYWAAPPDPSSTSRFSILHNFGQPGDSPSGSSGITSAPPGVGPDGTLYGTTSSSSSSPGAVYCLNTNGTSSSFRYLTNTYWNSETTPVLSGTSLYGTDEGGLFKLDTDGTGFTEFLSLTAGGNNRQFPWDLVLAGGTLYGTTCGGGNGWGSVFRIETNGTGYMVLYSFGASSNDGTFPEAGLVLGGSTLYGTTSEGGPSDSGTVFKINTDGSGYAILKAFGADERCPWTELVVSSGSTLFGTTTAGGLYGKGTVFKINTDGSGYAVLRNFSGPDGSSPNGVVLSGSTLYGTTSSGGFYGAGVLFSLALPLPTIATLLQDQTVEVGGTVQFQVAANGSGPLTYQWFFNGTNALSAATGPVLELTNVQPSQAGVYAVVVTDSAGSSSPLAALLNVIAPVPRRPAAGLTLHGQPGLTLNVDYTEALGAPPQWVSWTNVTLGGPSQLSLDLDAPLAPQRFYRGWHTNAAAPPPSLNLEAGTVITLTGAIGGSVRLDWINQFGPTDAWAPLATVTLTNTSQLYFDATGSFHAPRLYRLVPLP